MSMKMLANQQFVKDFDYHVGNVYTLRAIARFEKIKD
jgi:hypothetical protein